MKNSFRTFRDEEAQSFPHPESFGVTIEEAEICCEQARVAARGRRFRAARGLFSTAAALYQQALSQDGVSYESITRRLKQIETESAAYSELAGSLARPLASSTTPAQTAPHRVSAPRGLNVPNSQPGAALPRSPAPD